MAETMTRVSLALCCVVSLSELTKTLSQQVSDAWVHGRGLNLRDSEYMTGRLNTQDKRETFNLLTVLVL